MAEWKSVGYTKLSKSKKSLVVCIYADLPEQHATFAVGDLQKIQKILDSQNTATFVDLVTMKEQLKD